MRDVHEEQEAGLARPSWLPPRGSSAKLLMYGLCDIVTHMKTTIDIADAVLTEAKRVAAREGTTVRALVEESLREAIAKRRARNSAFHLRDASFKGQGTQPGVDLTDWSSVATAIYGGRGG
jgi:hypothetical protein